MESQPIVREGGFAGQELCSPLGFWVKMNFVMQPGTVVASAP